MNVIFIYKSVSISIVVRLYWSTFVRIISWRLASIFRGLICIHSVLINNIIFLYYREKRLNKSHFKMINQQFIKKVKLSQSNTWIEECQSTYTWNKVLIKQKNYKIQHQQ